MKQLRHEHKEERKKSAHLQDVITGMFMFLLLCSTFYALCCYNYYYYSMVVYCTCLFTILLITVMCIT